MMCQIIMDSFRICLIFAILASLSTDAWFSSPLHSHRRIITNKRYSSHMHTLGKISLVGAGPGDPDLLTLQALKLINNATLVIADRLISPEILDLVKCELRIARKHPGCAEKAQEEIYEWVREGIQQGHNVVRLKIGDPYLFGRGGEEMLEFRKLGVEPVVAAGVSSSYCAPMSSNIPLTHRGIANQVLISTGYGRDSTVVDVPPYSSDRTVVLLMAVGRLRDITANMTDAGYPVHTPIAIIERATTPQQRTLYGTLESIADIAEKQKARAPATIVVGEVINVLKTNVYGNGLGDGLPNPTHKEDNLIVSSEMLFPSMRQKAVESFAASRNLSRIL